MHYNLSYKNLFKLKSFLESKKTAGVSVYFDYKQPADSYYQRNNKKNILRKA